MAVIPVLGWLATDRPENLGRVVMRAPPDWGSEIVDVSGDHALSETAMRAAASGPGKGDRGPASRFGPADFDLGVIAGDVTPNPFLASLIEGRGCGRVSLESSRLEGMADHIIPPATQRFLMNTPLVIARTPSFLEAGAFDHGLTLHELARRINRRQSGGDLPMGLTRHPASAFARAGPRRTAGRNRMGSGA